VDTVINASEAVTWVKCRRRAWFDRNPPSDLQVSIDPFDELIQQRGRAHEERIRDQYDSWTQAESLESTDLLIDQGTEVIYQPHLEDRNRGLRGRPDFLERTPSGEYQVADAKLANSLRDHPEIKIQLAVYRKLLNSRLPAKVFLGSGEVEEVGDEVSKEADKFVTDMQSILDSAERPAVHYVDSKCRTCPYDGVCRPDFEKNSDLSLIPGLDKRSIGHLHAMGIKTIEALAKQDYLQIPDIPYLKGEAKKRRVVMQAKSLSTGDIVVVEPLEFRRGEWIHIDFEANPFSELTENEVYLWGLLYPPGRQEDFDYSFSPGGRLSDERAWLEFIGKLAACRERYEAPLFVHYSPYERMQIDTYAKRYGMKNQPTVNWLLSREGPLLDLRELVMKSLALPVTGYGLKEICRNKALVNFQWQQEESGSQWSVVQYIDFLNESDASKRERIRQSILTYNRDDVCATRALEMWLRAVSGHDVGNRGTTNQR
jgi:uncharacterized protein